MHKATNQYDAHTNFFCVHQPSAVPRGCGLVVAGCVFVVVDGDEVMCSDVMWYDVVSCVAR